jgi:hypothetical protein
MKGKRSKTTWIVSGVILLLAVVLTITGAAGFWMRGGDFVNASLRDMRNYAVLRTAAGAIIDELAVAAKREAREYADANKYRRSPEGRRGARRGRGPVHQLLRPVRPCAG